MACIIASSLRAWTQSVLLKDIVESWHSRLLHSYTDPSRSEGFTRGNSSYYYYVVCNFRQDMTEEWQMKVYIVPSRDRSLYLTFKGVWKHNNAPLCSKRIVFQTKATEWAFLFLNIHAPQISCDDTTSRNSCQKKPSLYHYKRCINIQKSIKAVNPNDKVTRSDEELMQHLISL